MKAIGEMTLDKGVTDDEALEFATKVREMMVEYGIKEIALARDPEDDDEAPSSFDN